MEISQCDQALTVSSIWTDVEARLAILRLKTTINRKLVWYRKNEVIRLDKSLSLHLIFGLERNVSFVQVCPKAKMSKVELDKLISGCGNWSSVVCRVLCAYLLNELYYFVFFCGKQVLCEVDGHQFLHISEIVSLLWTLKLDDLYPSFIPCLLNDQIMGCFWEMVAVTWTIYIPLGNSLYLLLSPHTKASKWCKILLPYDIFRTAHSLQLSCVNT